VCAKFLCGFALRIKKALWVFREPIPRTRTPIRFGTRLPGPKRLQKFMVINLEVPTDIFGSLFMYTQCIDKYG